MIAGTGPVQSDPALVPTRPRGNAAPPGASALVPRPDVPAPPPGTEVAPTRRLWLRVLFALDVVGAGAPGVLMLVSPDDAADLLFGGGLAAGPATAVLGCIWIALGLLSLAGVARPVTFSPVLLVQFVYKLVWLCAVGIPAALAGDGLPPVLTAIFAGWVVAVGLAAPWGTLFGPRMKRVSRVPPEAQ